MICKICEPEYVKFMPLFIYIIQVVRAKERIEAEISSLEKEAKG